MKRVFLITTCLLMFSMWLVGQENLEVEGAIKIANSVDPTPDPGTIRWTGSDFEGWNGTNWVSLTAGEPAVKDIDNNAYPIVTIGTQTWMAENLRVTRCNDGTAIPLVEVDTSWENLSTPGYAWFNNNAPDHEDYGALYNWYAVNDCNICPTGWHVPTDTQWTILTDYLGGLAVAGGKMKEAGFIHWDDPNTNATNESGWSAFGGGIRFPDGFFADFRFFGTWWSSTESGVKAWFRDLHSFDGEISRLDSDKRLGCSVRCLKD